MNMEKISSACLLIFDELKDNPEAQELIEKIDEAENDEDIKSGIKEALCLIEKFGKITLANEIREKVKGFID